MRLALEILIIIEALAISYGVLRLARAAVQSSKAA